MPPFPLMHVDTTWKFKEVIRFRDETAKRLGFDLIVHVNQEGVERGIGPFSHGSQVHTDVMKTEALKQALNKYGFDAAYGGARRDEEKSRAKENGYFLSGAVHITRTRRDSDRNSGLCTTHALHPARMYAYSLCPTGPNSMSGSTYTA